MKTKDAVGITKQRVAVRDLKARKNPQGGNTYSGTTTVNAGTLAPAKPAKPRPKDIELFSF